MTITHLSRDGVSLQVLARQVLQPRQEHGVHLTLHRVEEVGAGLQLVEHTAREGGRAMTSTPSVTTWIAGRQRHGVSLWLLHTSGGGMKARDSDLVHGWPAAAGHTYRRGQGVKGEHCFSDSVGV